MKKLIPIALLLINGICFAQEIQIKKGIGFPLTVEVTGSVHKSAECFEYNCKDGQGITMDNRIPQQGYFLGVTAIIGGEEMDFAYRVKPVSGRFKETYTLSASALAKGGGGNVTWVAALWRVMEHKNCCAAQNNGRACKYCNKNGFHLESRVTKATASN